MTQMRTSFDDLNWGRLSLISARDTADGQDFWEITQAYGERVVRVRCWALPHCGIPHGVDNDVSSALIDLVMSAGLPENGELTVSISELARLAGFHHNGKYRALVKETLERLHTTSFEIAGGWRDHPNRRWTTAKFHFIEGLTYTHQGEAGKFDERTMIRLRLAEPLIASLRSGYTKPLNIEFMQKLSRPRTRILFRLLDATRYNPETPDEMVDAFSVGLMSWAETCKLSATRASKVREALEAPHVELLRMGYLKDVRYEGRGLAQVIHYEFRPEFAPVSPELMQRMRRHGVVDGVARSLAQRYSTAVLMARIAHFEALVHSGQLKIKKTAAHALVHLLNHPDQYPPAPRRAGEVVTLDARPRRAPAPEGETAVVSWAEEIASLSPEDAANRTVRRVTMFYPKKFSVVELDVMRELVLRGQLDPVEVVSQATHRLATLDAQGFVDDLRARLAADA